MTTQGFQFALDAFHAATTTKVCRGEIDAHPDDEIRTPRVIEADQDALEKLMMPLDCEIDQLADALALKFEELSLIHQLSEQLDLEIDPGAICRELLDQLASCIHARTLTIELEGSLDSDFDEEDVDAGESCDVTHFLTGQPMSLASIRSLADHCTGVVQAGNPSARELGAVSIANLPASPNDVQVRVLVVPITRQGRLLGRMVALRDLSDPEFGTAEGDLMKSTSMMLGVHLINQRQYREMQEMFAGMIQSLVSALDAKDAYTCGHSSRVADLAVELATRLGMSDEDIKRIHMAGMLHDIGKIGVQDSVLQKPGRLTHEEFEQIKQHPVLGYEILRGIRPFRQFLPAVRHHHEAWDGSGYPDGLVADAIPRDAQILAVADAFDAMTSDRPYRSGMPLEKVIEIFRGGRGRQWAADVVDVLLSCPEVTDSYASKEIERGDDEPSIQKGPESTRKPSVPR